MYNKNLFFYNTHGNYKNINLNTLLPKIFTRKPCLRTIKVRAKNDITYDHFRYYSSAYSGSFY